MMKKSLCFSLAFVFIISFLLNSVSKGQPTTWAQPGAHWYYTEGDLFYSYGYFEIWEDGDTTFSTGIVCDILRSYREGIITFFPGGPYSQPGPTWYTYQSNDTVYIYYNNEFHILFIDNQAPGELFITGPDIAGGCDGDTVIIDSLYSVTLSGITMNKIVPVVPDWWDGQWPPGGSSIAYHNPIYTRFGSTGFMIPAPNCITDVAFGPLRCYSDSSGFSFTTNATPTCDYITSINDVSPAPTQFIITPNPAKDEITVVADISVMGTNEIGEIYNASGSNAGSFLFCKKTQRINISNLSPGQYFIKIKNRPQMKPVSFLKL